MSSDQLPVVEVTGLSKTYDYVKALDSATLSVWPREVMALVGDNGAGKSTLAKVICGAVQPDTGALSYSGRIVPTSSVRTAQEFGIETVYQDLALAPDLDIVQNLFLGRERAHSTLFRHLGAMAQRTMRAEAREALKALGLGNIGSLSSPVHQLSGGQQQAIAVARAIMWAKTLVIMDEPTASLGVRQTHMVYETMRHAVDRGLSVLVISHSIPTMLTVASRVAVMRHGRVIAVLSSESTSVEEVLRLMLGNEEVAA
jgi:simple sugar transport system ATP-binding protein